MKQELPHQSFLLTAVLVLGVAPALGQTDPGPFRPLTLAPADAHASGAAADDEKAKAAALAKATLNPIASLISLPLQNNFDWGAGPDGDGFQYKLNVQPVIPLSPTRIGTLSPGRFCPTSFRRTSSAPPASRAWRTRSRVCFSRR